MSSQDFIRSKNKIIAGVCGGIANAINLDSVWVRLIFAFLTLVTGIIPGLVAYLILWLVMPEA